MTISRERGRRKTQEIAPEHKETSKEDINVGNFYLDTKDWKGLCRASSRPWCWTRRTLKSIGDWPRRSGIWAIFADARAYYQKVAEYDPESRHGKEAIKALREPEIAHAKSHPAGQPAAGALK